MKTWELYHSVGKDGEGKPTSSFTAELSEQPWICYGLGRIPDLFWSWCAKHLPEYFHDPQYDSELFGWRLRWELWSSFDAPRWRRRSIEWVRVADRDPDTWFQPGGDTPLKDAT